MLYQLKASKYKITTRSQFSNFSSNHNHDLKKPTPPKPTLDPTISLPTTSISQYLHLHRFPRQFLKPPINILPNSLLNLTLIGRRNILTLLFPTRSTKTPIIIHSSLQRIALPAKYVVAVLAVTCVVAGAEVEGLATVGGPVGFVVELGGVPDDLELGKGVSCWVTG